MPVFNAVLTNQAEGAALDYDNTQIALQITHVGFGTSTAVADLDQLSVLGEVGRVAVAGGGIEPNSRTLTANVIWTPDQVRDIGQIGFYAGDTLFCIYAPSAVIVRVTPDVGIAASFSVSLVRLPNGSVNIMVDDSLSPMMLLLGQHQAAANPHPQYAMLQYVNTQINNLRTYLLGTILGDVVFGIGKIWTSETPEHPNSVLEPLLGYETFWRQIVGRSLMAIDVDNPLISNAGSYAGNMNSAATNTGGGALIETVTGGVLLENLHPVYLVYMWERYDPSNVLPMRTVNITQDMFDVNLLQLFTAQYGSPRVGERVTFIVASGVLVTATTVNNYAVVTGDWPSQTQLMMDVFGVVSGRGGDAGRSAFSGWNAGSPNVRVDVPAVSGANGGNGINAQYPLVINNQGVVSGGGGGGAGAGHWEAGDPDHNVWGAGCGGFGSGGGAPYGRRATNIKTYDWLMEVTGVADFDRTYTALWLWEASGDISFTSNGSGWHVIGNYAKPAGFPEIVSGSGFKTSATAEDTGYIVMSSNGERMSAGRGGSSTYTDFSGNVAALILNAGSVSEANQLKNTYRGSHGGEFGQSGEDSLSLTPHIRTVTNDPTEYRNFTASEEANNIDYIAFGGTGGLAGIAITGPVTVTGNPVLGR